MLLYHESTIPRFHDSTILIFHYSFMLLSYWNTYTPSALGDAAQGYRTMFESQVDTVTAWPSLLALGATCDVSLAYEYGSALAKEFRAKGSFRSRRERQNSSRARIALPPRNAACVHGPSANVQHGDTERTTQYRHSLGANVLLGPSVNVHRVPRNGRNAEYIR